ncbi:MAG: hypothetical protein Kow0074_08070 [Candidatus Zixiibacteriota bacterium]
MNSKTMWLAVLAVLMIAAVAAPSLAATTAESTAPARLGPIDPRPGVTLADLSNQVSLHSTLALTGAGPLLAQTDTDPDFGGDVYGYKPKSSRRAFLQSLVVPGWGQWYNGSRIKPFVFLGLEAAGWYFWSDYRGNGNDLEDRYKMFVDAIVDQSTGLQRWDFDRYINGLKRVYDIDDDSQAWRVPGTQDSTFFSHHVSEQDAQEKNNTYYENIGKYDQFAFGWHDFQKDTVNGIEWDFRPGDTVDVDGVRIRFLTPDRASYVAQRDDANREFNKASTVLILTIGNHLLSAFEAAIGAKRYNRSRDQFGSIDADLRLTETNLSTELAPRFTVRYRF